MLQSITKRVSDASSLSCPAHDCSLSSNQAVFPKCKDEPLLGPFTAKRKRHLARRLRSFSRDAALCYAIPGEQPPWTHLQHIVDDICASTKRNGQHTALR